MVETIGKPVFHRYSGDLFGSWLMDAYEFTDEEEKTKIWATVSDNNKTLFEFSNKTMYRENRPTKNYTLPKPFTVSCTTFVGATLSPVPSCRETTTSSTTEASFTTTTGKSRGSSDIS